MANKRMDFGHRKRGKFQFGEKTERTHCPRCMRSKAEAISDQVAMGCVCDDANCIFEKEILEALQRINSDYYCINCGNKLSHDDRFCFNCGCRRLESI